MNFLAPFKFYRNKPRALTVEAMFNSQAGAVVANCRLTGSRTVRKQAEPEVTTHFTARVRLSRQLPEPVAGAAVVEPTGKVITADDIYRIYFHGPAYRVLEKAWRDGDRVIGQMACELPVHHNPPEKLTLVSPRLIELCFQTAGLWEMGVQDRMGLPQYIKQVRFWRMPDASESRFYALITSNGDGSFDAEVVDAAGNRCLYMSGYRTAALPYAVDSGRFKVLQSGRAVGLAG